MGSEATGRNPYTFYKPTMGPKYVSTRPYNKFTMPKTFIQPIISILNGFLLLSILWAHTMPSRDVNTVTWLPEASWRWDNYIYQMMTLTVCFPLGLPSLRGLFEGYRVHLVLSGGQGIPVRIEALPLRVLIGRGSTNRDVFVQVLQPDKVNHQSIILERLRHIKAW